MPTVLRLCGVALPQAQDTPLYTALNAVAISTMAVCNRAATPTTFRLAHVPAGAPLQAGDYFAYDAPIAAQTTVPFTLGICLATGDVLSGWAAGAAVTVMAWGEDEGLAAATTALAATESPVERLCGIALLAAQEQVIYRATRAVAVSTLLVCNRGAVATTLRLAHVVAGGAPHPGDYFVYDAPVAPHTTVPFTLGICLAAGDELRAWAASATVTVMAWGEQLAPPAQLPGSSALAGLVGLPDTVGYFTSRTTAALTPLTETGRGLLASPSLVAARAHLGLGELARHDQVSRPLLLDEAVSLPKIAHTSQGLMVLGRRSSGPGPLQEIPLGSGLQIGAHGMLEVGSGGGVSASEVTILTQRRDRPHTVHPAPAPIKGHLVFNEVTHQVWVYDGTQWRSFYPANNYEVPTYLEIGTGVDQEIVAVPPRQIYIITTNWRSTPPDIHPNRLDAELPRSNWGLVADQVTITGAAAFGIAEGTVLRPGTLVRRASDGQFLVHPGVALPDTRQAQQGDLLEITDTQAHTFGWVRHKLPEIILSVSRHNTNGYVEVIPLRTYGEIKVSGISQGHSLYLNPRGGHVAGEFLGVWMDGITPKIWNTSLPVVTGAPERLIFGRISATTILYWTIDLHRLPDGTHIGNLRVVNSDHHSIDGTVHLPSGNTELVLGAYAGEVGDLEIEGIAYE